MKARTSSLSRASTRAWDGLAVLVALLDGHDVGVGLGGSAVVGLHGQGVGDLQTGVNGIVAVDNGHVHVLQGGGQQPGLQLLDLEVLGVVHDILDRGLQAGILGQGDETLLLEEQQGAAAVGGVVGDGDLRAVGQSVQRSGLAGVEAEGLIVDGAGADQVGCRCRR